MRENQRWGEQQHLEVCAVQLVATKEIGVGEELTISYLDEGEGAAELLERFGVRCWCLACQRK